LDVSEFSSWAVDSIDVAYANSIVNGTGNGKYSPSGYATKEQALVIVNNILKKYLGYAFDYEDKSKATLHMTIEDRTDTTNNAEFVKVYYNNKYLGYTDNQGKLDIYNLEPGFHEFKMVFKDETIVSSGAYSKANSSAALMWIDSSIINTNKARKFESAVSVEEVSVGIELPKVTENFDKKITLLYDVSVPLDVQIYIDGLLLDARPVIDMLLGEPSSSHTYTLKYDEGKHLGYNIGKTISTMSTLLNIGSKNDPNIDK